MKYYGQFETDKIIETYFPGKTDGVCIEVGAADGIKGSNTLLFEELGWQVMCIEPIPEYAALCRDRRLYVVEGACGAKDGKEDFTIFDIGEKNILSSLSSLDTDDRLFGTHGHLINSTKTIKVDVFTLETILNANPWWEHTPIDFISIDTEGTELDVLKGIDLTQRKIPLLVVENNFDDPDFEAYLKQFGYTKDQRYEINDFYIL